MGGAGGVGLLWRKMLLLLSRIKSSILLLIGEYETVSLRSPGPILCMEPVLRLMTTWLPVAHSVHCPLTHSIPQHLTNHTLSKLPRVHPLLVSQWSSIHTI